MTSLKRSVTGATGSATGIPEHVCYSTPTPNCPADASTPVMASMSVLPIEARLSYGMRIPREVLDAAKKRPR